MEKGEFKTKELKFVLIGAGMRGQAYARIACLDYGCELVAVAEPNDDQRLHIQQKYGVSEQNCFISYEQLLKQGKIADFAIIATQDQMHYEIAMMAISCGYHLLLEKPIAPTPEECVAIWRAAEKKDVQVIVGHVLRYTPFFRAVKELIDAGKIGRIVSVIHTEGVGNIHQSHSYVRGNWHNSKQSSNMLLGCI